MEGFVFVQERYWIE